MLRRLLIVVLGFALAAGSVPASRAQDISIPRLAPEDYPPGIPAAAWNIPIGWEHPHPARPKVIYPMIDDGPIQGLPVGGFGAGTFTRTLAGNFARWHINVGEHYPQTLPAVMFSVYTQQGAQEQAQALWTSHPASELGAWQWDYPVGAGRYFALYPRAWWVYESDALPVTLTVEQLTPILPHDYRVTSYPVALFTWTAHNPTPQPVTVGLMFTAQSLVTGSLRHTARTADTPVGLMIGVALEPSETPVSQEGQGSLALAALEVPGARVGTSRPFDAQGDGAGTWQDFAADGALDGSPATPAESPRGAIGTGLSATFELEPGETRRVPFALAWDSPIMTFGRGDSWYKRYTAFFGRAGDRAWDIAAEGLAQADAWRAAVEAWQAPILADESVPLWYKTALFNELYYLADGGTAWEHGQVGAPAPDPDYLGRFAYLECYDYPFYNTFDVDFYASFALLALWPEIELGILRDFAAAIPAEDPSRFRVGYDGSIQIRKLAGAVPHDLGRPSEAPWLRPNAFTWQNVNRWKDLNAKFVLRLYRDAVLLDRPDLVRELWPAAVEAMDYLAALDGDGDGIPENEGRPDQTYDTWPATGVSAYSGGLWVAALAAMREMAVLVGDDAAAADYAARFERARAVYEDRLWTGSYYAYDETSDTIMADQLAGEWYARVSGLATLPDERIRQALTTIHARNVQGFEGGLMGAVNGMRPDGAVQPGEQAEEVWAGTTYLLAAHMLWHGLDEAAWETAFGAYRHVYETGGLWFRTPEAWDASGNYRASMYMRPLAIWAVQTALEER